MYAVVHMTVITGQWTISHFKADGYIETQSGSIVLYRATMEKGDPSSTDIASFPKGFCAGIWEDGRKVREV